MRKMWIACLLCLATFGVQAQDVYNSSGRAGGYKQPNQGGFDRSKIIFGGGIGLGFGNVTSIAVSPVIGYRFSNRFSAGVGLAYQYLRIKDEVALFDQQINNYRTFPLKASLFSPSVWARFVVWDNIFVHVEPELDFQTAKYYDYDTDPASPTVNQPKQFKQSYTTPAFFVGGGYRQPISDNASLIAVLLYDVIQDPDGPYYKRPIDFRIGFLVGF